MKDKLIKKFIEIHDIMDRNCIYEELGGEGEINKLLDELKVLLNEYYKEKMNV